MKNSLAVAMVLGAIPVLAHAQAAERKVEAVAKPKKVCRSHRETGSNMAVTTCRPQAEWDQIDGDHSTADAIRDVRLQQPH